MIVEGRNSEAVSGEGPSDRVKQVRLFDGWFLDGPGLGFMLHGRCLVLFLWMCSWFGLRLLLRECWLDFMMVIILFCCCLKEITYSLQVLSFVFLLSLRCFRLKILDLFCETKISEIFTFRYSSV